MWEKGRRGHFCHHSVTACRLRGGDRKIGNGRPMIAPTDLLYGKRDVVDTFATTPSLRATSLQGEAICKATIEGSSRQKRLRGGNRKIGNGRPMIAPTKYKNAKKNTAVSAVSKTYTYWGE